MDFAIKFIFDMAAFTSVMVLIVLGLGVIASMTCRPPSGVPEGGSGGANFLRRMRVLLHGPGPDVYVLLPLERPKHPGGCFVRDLVAGTGFEPVTFRL